MMKLLLVSVVVVAVIIVTSQAAAVLIHQDVTLTCSIGPTAPRSSAVFWYSNGIHEYLTSDFTTIKELNNTARSVYRRLSAVGSQIRGEYNLRITDVRAEDEGVYLCGYYQPNGTWFTVKTEKLDVLIPPGREFPACSIQTSSDDALLAPDTLVNLTCISYGGSPPANLVWYRAGVRVEGVAAHGGLWVYLQHRILDDDSGVEFTCQATSPALSEPKSCSITPYRRASQLYIKHDHGGLVAMGESATFTCAIRELLLQDGEVYYRWYINGALVEERGSKSMLTADGGTLTLLNITTGDDKSIVSCEKVDDLTARSSASMSILVVSPSSLNHPGLYQSEQPDNSTKDPPLNTIGLTIGAFFCGMFLMLFLIFVFWLAANARRRGRLDISHRSKNRKLFVGWQKIVPKTTEIEKLNHCAIHLEKSTPSSVRTFKKPFISVKPSNGNPDSLKGETLHRDDPSGCNGVGVTPLPSMSQKAKIAASHDPLPTYKKPSPLRLMSESGRPLLASPAESRNRGYSVDRDYTASMPDLALRYFGEPALSTLDHDYVNLPAVPSSKDGSGSSTPSYVNCEYVSPPPKSPKLSLPRSNPQRKSLSYAELDLPCIGDRPPTPVSPKSPAGHKSRAGSVSVERTKYAEIAYVFKDRRQQSLPSVKLVGLSEGFGVKV